MTVSRRRIQGAVAGTVALTDLTAEERLVANIEIDAAIAEAAAQVDYGATLAGERRTAVALDDHGRLRRYMPDGTSVIVD